MNLLNYNVRKGNAVQNGSEEDAGYMSGRPRGAAMPYTGFTTAVILIRGAAGFRNESESGEAASRFVRAVYTARLIEIVEVLLPVRAEEALRFGRQEKRYFLVR